MQILFNISKSFSTPFVSINAQHKSNDLTIMATAIDKIINQESVIGYQDERRKVIPFYQIVSIHTDNKKVFCETKNDMFHIKKRIYEMKKVLPKTLFVQLSNSEIVNISQIKEFSLSQTGSYQVGLSMKV